MRRPQGVTVADAREAVGCTAAAVRDAVRTLKDYGIAVSTQYAEAAGKVFATYRSAPRTNEQL